MEAWCADRAGHREALGHNETLNRLSGDLGDHLEVLVDVQDGQPRQLSGGGNDQVGDRVARWRPRSARRGCTSMARSSDQAEDGAHAGGRCGPVLVMVLDARLAEPLRGLGDGGARC